jgi:cell division ATPase FtsA
MGEKGREEIERLVSKSSRALSSMASSLMGDRRIRMKVYAALITAGVAVSGIVVSAEAAAEMLAPSPAPRLLLGLILFSIGASCISWGLRR